MEFYDYIKFYFTNVDKNNIRVNFHTTSDDGTMPENVYKCNEHELDFDWNNYLLENEYANKTNIYIISFYQSKDNYKNFVLNGIFYVDANKYFWKLYDAKIYKQYGKLTVQYENRKNNYPMLSTVIEKGCKIVYMEDCDEK